MCILAFRRGTATEMIYRDNMLKSDLGHSSTELASFPARSVRFLPRLPARIATLVFFSGNIPHFTAGQQLAAVLRSETRGRVFLHQQPNPIARRTNPNKYIIVVRRTAEKRRVRSISPEMKRRIL